MTAHITSAKYFSRIWRVFAAATVVALLTSCAGSQTKESTGEMVDDSAITAKVKTALLSDKEIRAFDVHVETFKGRVELSGFVPSEADKLRAVKDANSVEGVKSVENGLVIKSQP